ncbi:hypothetical protein, partial [Paenibacillus daejeonensis]|uniref:hypothetical protein n=1 Tax=Paenibacillus daejeonensis TaxID=135193 RepID=UPI001B7F8426
VLGTPPAFVLSQDQTLHDRKLNSSFLAGIAICNSEELQDISLVVQFSKNTFSFVCRYRSAATQII